MRELFHEYGLFMVEVIGASLVIGLFFKIFWGNDSLLAPYILQMLDMWM